MARIRNRSSNAIPGAAAKISETKRRQRKRARNRGRTLSTNPKRNNGRIRAVCAALYGSTDIPREVVRCARLWTRILRFSREFLRDCALAQGEKRNHSLFLLRASRHITLITVCFSFFHVSFSAMLFKPPSSGNQ